VRAIWTWLDSFNLRFRYVVLFNGRPEKKARVNVKANDLLQEYFQVHNSYLYMPFCPFLTAGGKNLPPFQSPAELDKDMAIKGDVIIFCEQLVNGKTQLVKPDKWPTELYMKTVGNNENKIDPKTDSKKKRK